MTLTLTVCTVPLSWAQEESEKQVAIKLQGLIEGPAVEQYKQSIYRGNNKHYDVYSYRQSIYSTWYN